MPHIDNKRIAKNTMFLYLRMGLTMIVNLYSVKVIWNVLGIDNYGIYNVVGGIVLIFTFLNNAMVASSQRFISYELGTGDIDRLKRVFSIAIKVHYILAVIILFLAETLGLWFLNNEMNIPIERMFAANCVYQFSIAAFFVNVVSVPYNACIVAHEHMKIYGYYGILNVVLKLLILALLVLLPFDKLITYAALVFCVELFMRLLYQWYCKKHFEECSFVSSKDKGLMKEMFSFAGWSFLGNMGFSFRDQGLNIILNMFFGVTMNAAKGIATQATSALGGFAGNFTMALNPQITKSYAAGDLTGMNQLILRGCKFSFLLLSIFVIPIIVSCDELLHLWLGNVEAYTSIFLRLMLVTTLVDSMVSPITTALQATGHIKTFQIMIAAIMLSCLPIAWVWLSIDSYPLAVVIIPLVASLLALYVRANLLRQEVGFSVRLFFSYAIFRCYTVVAIMFIVCSQLYRFNFFQSGISSTIIYLILSCLMCTLISILALTNQERNAIFGLIRKKLHINHTA